MTSSRRHNDRRGLHPGREPRSVAASYLPPILHRFRDIAFDRSKIAIFGWLPLLCLALPTEGFPMDDLRKIFRGCQWMAKVPNAAEILSKISPAWEECTSVTDRDRQTDGRATAYSDREREFTFAENGSPYAIW